MLTAGSLLEAQIPEPGRYPFFKKIAETAPGISTIYEGTPDDFRRILTDNTSEADNHRLEKVKGDLFVQYGMEFPAISAHRLDYYWNIEEAPRQAGKTKVTLFLALGNDNFMPPTTYPDEFQAASRFMSSLRQDLQVELMRQVLEELEEAYEVEMKKLRELNEEARDQAKRKIKLEAALSELLSTQAETATEIDKQTQLMEQLRTQLQELRTRSDAGY